MHERIAEIAWASVASTEGGAAALRKAADLGFTTLLVNDAEHATIPLETVVATARSAGLATWLAVTLDAAGSPLFSARALPPVDPWLVDGDAALDPRRPPLSVRPAAVARDRVEVAAWAARLRAAVTAGVTGFVCLDADRLPAAVWATLIEGSIRNGGSLRWVAWTPGLASEAITALIDAGFDTACLSSAWWDGRERWLVDEAARLSQVRTLAFPSDPFGIEAPAKTDGPSIAARLRIAAFVADALLVPQAVWTEHAADLLPVHRWLATRDEAPPRGPLWFVSGPEAPVTAVVRTPAHDLRASDEASLLLINPDAQRPARLAGASVTTALSGFGRFEEAMPGDGAEASTLDPCSTIDVRPAGIRVFSATRLPMVVRPVPADRRSTEAALKMPRLSIEAITPTVDGGRFPVKRTAGEAVRIEADIVIDGHEKLSAVLLHRAAGEREWRETRMEPIGNDRFAATMPLARVGRHEFTIEAWRDVFATFRNELDKKSAAGLDVSLELMEGRLLIDQAVAHARTLKKPHVLKRLLALAKRIAAPAGDGGLDRATMAGQVAALLASQTLADLFDADLRAFATRPDTVFPIEAERDGASFAAWYELFPRSLGNPPGTEATHHGSFDDVIERLPAVRAMGFDVLYFPPIHPIGRRNRKGRNNSLTALDDDPGSPYAIGSEHGGHDALHPQLGTFDDFRRLREAALDNGLELALDFAIQCSPDHPWLADHPGWFAWRPDGSLRYAENPPKKYEDIVNVDFYGEGRRGDAAAGLWSALRDVILLWVEQGVRIFRVDNPHTKPLPFWEWMIGEVRSRHPDVIFLSEAFTRPKVMYRLAKVGFSQSYTYFTWRHTKQEFIDYLTELTGPESREALRTTPRDFFRPHFFVNTPDINPVFLQRSGRAGFLIRAALAATLSGLWGVYSGFELCEATPVPGKEDYLDSEKYQLRAWDWQRPGNIVAEITALNRIRRENPAMRTHLNVRFLDVFDPDILYFAKATEDRGNVVLVAINLDPFGVHEAGFELPLWQWGRADDATVEATDLLDGHRFRWTGKHQRMRLDPAINPYAIWRVAV